MTSTMPQDPAQITASSRPGDGEAPAGARDPSRMTTVRGAAIMILVAVFILVAFEGQAVRRAADRHKAGWQRDVLQVAGKPTGWVADRLPFSGIGDRFNRVIQGDTDGGAPATAAVPAAGGGGAAITEDAFDGAALGGKVVAPRPLKTVLVTGDSMSQPMDADLARKLAGSGIKTTRDVHIGTSVSQPEIVDWRGLAATQSATSPDAVIVFLGANEGFPMRLGKRTVECCTAPWAAAYARALQQMMAAYRQRGDVRVYWMLLPDARDAKRQEIVRAVNAGIRTAASLDRAHIRLVDLHQLFTPGSKYRDAMPVDGRDQIVRRSDGIHLNDAGAAIATDAVLDAMRRDYGDAVPAP
ncbi:GDSL-type esterase/lipase family protein [Patulibacter sp. NPDC049589]|uniref:DUF459 domain-containing protein n=1 Tax=Patulibacter sp. NPDC049589 TaxID=3154731 RepID=UPI003421BD86